MMKPISLIFTGLTVALALPAYADFGVGQRVPAPTALNQHPVSVSYLGGFVWSPVTLPYGVNGTGQMAVGGTVDATTRLSVNPQGTGENGLTVKMPSGATGYGWVVRNSTNAALAWVDANGYYNATNGVRFYSDGNAVLRAVTSGSWVDNVQSSFFQLSQGNGIFTAQNGLTLGRFGAASNFTSFSDYDYTVIPVPVGLVDLTTKYTTKPVLVLHLPASGTQDSLEIMDSTNVVKAKVDKNFVMTAKGYASSVRVVTATDTATLTDSVLLVSGTFTETLPATGWPTGYRLVVKDTGTGTITLTAGGTVTFDGATTLTFATQYKSRVLIFDGVNFQIESGLL